MEDLEMQKQSRRPRHRSGDTLEVLAGEIMRNPYSQAVQRKKYKYKVMTEIRRAYGPLACQILREWSLVVLLIPPTPQWAPGAAYVHRQSLPWSPGRSNFRRTFFRLHFGCYFGLVLDPFWGRLGLLLDLFWEPNSSQVGTKMRLESSFFSKT